MKYHCLASLRVCPKYIEDFSLYSITLYITDSIVRCRVSIRFTLSPPCLIYDNFNFRNRTDFFQPRCLLIRFQRTPTTPPPDTQVTSLVPSLPFCPPDLLSFRINLYQSIPPWFVYHSRQRSSQRGRGKMWRAKRAVYRQRVPRAKRQNSAPDYCRPAHPRPH